MPSHLEQLAEAIHGLAEGVFEELDVPLAPDVGLVALSGEEREARPRVVHGPGAGGGWEALEAQLERGLRSGSARWAAAVGADVRESSRSTVLEAVAAVDASTPRLSFVSSPRPLGGEWVHVVLTVERAVHDAYHVLERDRSASGVPLARSLLDATIRQTLVAAAAAAAESASTAEGAGLPQSPEEVVAGAGRLLMRTPAIAAGNEQGADEFFQTCNRISTTRYEGRLGSGQMIVAEGSHPDVDTEIELRSRIDLRDHRGVRKVLELTGGGLAVLSDSFQVRGLGRVAGAYDRTAEDLFDVRFRSHATWELSHAGSVLMRVSDGHPHLPRSALDADEFHRLLEDVFGAPAGARFDRIGALAMRAAEQRHGTIVVVSAGAAEEAARLGGQALGLVPVPLTPDLLGTLTAIDGAVLVDPAGDCHAVGVILDGRATLRGDPARGARFNSAVRYVDASGHPCVAVVVSDGGGVDVIRPLHSG